MSPIRVCPSPRDSMVSVTSHVLSKGRDRRCPRKPILGGFLFPAIRSAIRYGEVGLPILFEKLLSIVMLKEVFASFGPSGTHRHLDYVRNLAPMDVTRRLHVCVQTNLHRTSSLHSILRYKGIALGSRGVS